LRTIYGKKGEKCGKFDNIPAIIQNVNDANQILLKIVTITPQNPSPQILDQ